MVLRRECQVLKNVLLVLISVLYGVQVYVSPQRTNTDSGDKDTTKNDVNTIAQY